jgi:2TM domain
MTEQVREEEEQLRDLAIRRIRRRLDFKAHLFAFVVVNGFLVVSWSLTGSGFFWPIFPDAGMGYRRRVQRVGCLHAG